MTFTGATAGLAAGAQTNETVLDWSLEATYKNPPTGRYQQGRFTAETLSRSQTTARPSEINTVKEVSQSVVTQISASGRISGALSTATYDDFFAGVLGADWGATSSVMAVSGNGLSLSFHGGDSGWLAGGDSIIFSDTTLLSKFPKGSLVVFCDPTSGASMVAQCLGFDSGATKSVMFAGGTFDVVRDKFSAAYGSKTVFNFPDGVLIGVPSLVNGNVDKTYTIRKKILSSWLMYPGSLINQMQLTFSQGQFAQVEVDIISANETISKTDISSALVPAPSGNVHNTLDNFLGCTLLGVTPSGCVTSAALTLARNGSKSDYGNGHADACGIITGQLEVSGSVSFYFRSWDQYQAALAGQQGPVIIKSVDSAGNGYAFVFLNAALRNPQAQTESVNKTYELKLDIEGNPAADGSTFAIFRLTSGA